MANYDGAIFVGHGTSEADGSYDSGATNGSKQEHIIAEKIVDKAVAICISKGLAIHRDEQNYKDNDLLGNTYTSNYAIEVHLNAGKGKRAELFTPCKDKNLNVEFYIMSELAKLGLVNGGVKSRDYNSEQTFIRTNGIALPYTDYYGVINRAYKQGISLDIVEVGFIDSSDLSIIENNIDKISNVIANGMLMACNKPINQQQNTIKKGYDNMLFNNKWYAMNYPDVVKSGMDLREHYEIYGKKEGRLPIPPLDPSFCSEDYLFYNPDVAKAIKDKVFQNSAEHWLMHGYEENRKIRKPQDDSNVKELEVKIKELQAKLDKIKSVL